MPLEFKYEGWTVKVEMIRGCLGPNTFLATAGNGKAICSAYASDEESCGSMIKDMIRKRNALAHLPEVPTRQLA
jgi:hypothetical protein